MTSCLGRAAWIIDSGATCYMCNEQSDFVKYQKFKTPLKVKLGDGYEVDGIGNGIVILTSQLPSGKHRKCKLHNVLHIPSLSYNLLSVPAVTEHGKTVQFEGTTCQILDGCKPIGIGIKSGEYFI